MVAMVGGFIVVGGLNPASLMMGGMMLMMTVGMVGSGRAGGPSKAQLATDRNDYLAYLDGLREDIDDVRTAQRAASSLTHPAPSALWSLAGGRRMWERRHHDADFTEVRIASGPQELASPLRPPQSGPINEVDPISAVALSQLVRTHAVVDDLPIAIQLGGFPVVDVGGDQEAARAMARAVVCQLATFHGPDGLLVAAAVDSAGRAEWDWLKWLPHNHHPRAHRQPRPGADGRRHPRRGRRAARRRAVDAGAVRLQGARSTPTSRTSSSSSTAARSPSTTDRSSTQAWSASPSWTSRRSSVARPPAPGCGSSRARAGSASARTARSTGSAPPTR